MQVDVILDARARDAAEVPAEVVRVRVVLRSQRFDPACAQAVDLERLLVGERAELAHVAVGCDEQVARRVRELVQHDQRELTAMHQ